MKNVIRPRSRKPGQMRQDSFSGPPHSAIRQKVARHSQTHSGQGPATLSHQTKSTCSSFVSTAVINYPGQKKLRRRGWLSADTAPSRSISGKAKATGLKLITATAGSRGKERTHTCARLPFSSFIRSRAQAWQVVPPSLGLPTLVKVTKMYACSWGQSGIDYPSSRLSR